MIGNPPLRKRELGESCRSLQGRRWCDSLLEFGRKPGPRDPDGSWRARASPRCRRRCDSAAGSSAVASRRWKRFFRRRSVGAGDLLPAGRARGWPQSSPPQGPGRRPVRETSLPGRLRECRSDPAAGLRFVQRISESAKECNDIRVSDRSRIHRDTPALPFCHVEIKTKKPKDSQYPSELRTLGDIIRAAPSATCDQPSQSSGL